MNCPNAPENTQETCFDLVKHESPNAKADSCCVFSTSDDLGLYASLLFTGSSRWTILVISKKWILVLRVFRDSTNHILNLSRISLGLLFGPEANIQRETGNNDQDHL